MLEAPYREGKYRGRKYRIEGAEPENEFQRHARARVAYIAARRQAESLDVQIAAMRELAA